MGSRGNGKSNGKGSSAEKRTYMKRQYRQFEILVSVITLNRGGKDATVHSVAKMMEVSASTKLRGMMDELTSTGYMTRKLTVHWNGANRYVYHVSMNAIEAVSQETYDALVLRCNKQGEFNW